MAGYVVKEYSRLMRPLVSLETSAIVVKTLDMSRVDRYLKLLPDDVADMVRRDFAEMELAAEYLRTGGIAHDAPVTPSVTSGKTLEEWISVTETAQILGKTEKTVRNYITAGKLEAKRKDKKSYLVLRESVDALLLGRQSAA